MDSCSSATRKKWARHTSSDPRLWNAAFAVRTQSLRASPGGESACQHPLSRVGKAESLAERFWSHRFPSLSAKHHLHCFNQSSPDKVLLSSWHLNPWRQTPPNFPSTRDKNTQNPSRGWLHQILEEMCNFSDASRASHLMSFRC